MTSNYPLAGRSVVAGVSIGILAALFTGTVLVGYAILVLCVTIGLTWRKDEAPIFPFILTFQWFQVTSGYFFWIITGTLPTAYPAGDVDRAVQIALTGLFVLAVGIRLAAAMLPEQEAQEDTSQVGNLRGLFWLVIGLYAVNYVSVLNTKTFATIDAILGQVLLVRQVPLLLLWSEVIRQQRQKMYLWASLVWILIPSFGSYFADFKTPLLLALIVLAGSWRPWERKWWRFTFAGTMRTAAIAGVAIFLALTWQAGVKRDTRKAYDTEAVGTNPMERVNLFLSSAATAVPIVFQDTQTVVESLVSRIWYIVFFSRVLEYVPAVEPHADGELLQLAVNNTVYPRFFFRDKPPLPSDSYYTRRFAGISVGLENSSIGIGYMAEFYSDWGIGGMFLSILAYGLLMGAAAWLVRAFVQPGILLNPALITVLLSVTYFEQQFIKTLGALTIATIVTIGILRVVRKLFREFLALHAAPQAIGVIAESRLRPTLQPRRRRDLLAARKPVS